MFFCGYLVGGMKGKKISRIHIFFLQTHQKVFSQKNKKIKTKRKILDVLS